LHFFESIAMKKILKAPRKKSRRPGETRIWEVHEYPDIMTVTEAHKQEILSVLQQYAAAYRNRDAITLGTLFSPDICGFGSGPDEIIRNHKEFVRQIARDTSQASAINVDFSETEIAGEGPVAWVMSRCAFTFTLPGSKKQTLHGRITMILANTGSRWLIRQIHFSMPYGGQVEGQSFPGAAAKGSVPADGSSSPAFCRSGSRKPADYFPSAGIRKTAPTLPS